jgi:hypothetical protein
MMLCVKNHTRDHAMDVRQGTYDNKPFAVIGSH